MPYVHSSYYVWYDLIVSTCDIGWWTWIINISYLKSVQCVVLTCWSSPSPVTVSDCTELGELQVAPLCLSLAPLRCKQLSADTATPGGSYLNIKQGDGKYWQFLHLHYTTVYHGETPYALSSVSGGRLGQDCVWEAWPRPSESSFRGQSDPWRLRTRQT